MSQDAFVITCSSEIIGVVNTVEAARIYIAKTELNRSNTVQFVSGKEYEAKSNAVSRNTVMVGLVTSCAATKGTRFYNYPVWTVMKTKKI